METRIKMLQAAAEICGYPYDDEEWQEIGRACLAIQQKVNEKLLASVQDNEELVKMVYRDLKAGNDAIFTVLDGYLTQGLKRLLRR